MYFNWLRSYFLISYIRFKSFDALVSVVVGKTVLLLITGETELVGDAKNDTESINSS